MRVLQFSHPKPCHTLPGWRERRRRGLTNGAVVCCDTCKRVYEFNRNYDGYGWTETLNSRILNNK